MWNDTYKYNNMISSFQCDFTCARDNISNSKLSELDKVIKNPDDPRHSGLHMDIGLLEELEWLLRNGRAKIMIKEGE